MSTGWSRVWASGLDKRRPFKHPLFFWEALWMTLFVDHQAMRWGRGSVSLQASVVNSHYNWDRGDVRDPDIDIWTASRWVRLRSNARKVIPSRLDIAGVRKALKTPYWQVGSCFRIDWGGREERIDETVVTYLRSISEWVWTYGSSTRSISTSSKIEYFTAGRHLLFLWTLT